MDSKRLKSGNVYLSILADEFYSESVMELFKTLKNKKVCFVTLNKSAENIERALALRRVSTKNVFFIDAFSKTTGKTPVKDNTIYVTSPAALTELSLVISEVIKTGAFDSIFFDSLSTLSSYNLSGSDRFVASLINKTKSAGYTGLLTCLQGDVKTELIEKSCMYVDEVLTVPKHPHLKNWAIFSMAGALLAGMTGFFLIDAILLPTGHVVGGAGTFQVSPIFSWLLTVVIIWAFVLAGGLIYRRLKLAYPNIVFSARTSRKKPSTIVKEARSKLNEWLSYLF